MSTSRETYLSRSKPRRASDITAPTVTTHGGVVFADPNMDASTYRFPWVGLLTLLILSSECAINFGTFAFVGLALKWDLTYGDEAPHQHPHVPEESYIQRPNNLLSIVMISTILNFAEGVVLLSFYCHDRSQRRKHRPVTVRCRCVRFCLLFFSWLCIILSGMSLAACWALQMELYPPDLRFLGCPDTSGCTVVCGTSGASSPPPRMPPPPPPVSPILPPGELYLLYALCGLLSLLKFFNYLLGAPPRLLRWTFPELV